MDEGPEPERHTHDHRRDRSHHEAVLDGAGATVLEAADGAAQGGHGARSTGRPRAAWGEPGKTARSAEGPASALART
jgi:hypothetical protein